jgi:RNA polymerase sigma factor (sigma-70 family)
MSPPALRRYRAERLLRQEFDALRRRVLAQARSRLLLAGAHLDPADLEACYAQAWQGLYMALLEGTEIESPAGWLVVVTFRRAIEEHRGRARAHGTRRGAFGARGETSREPGEERDLARELDDRASLRHLFEGLRGRLSGREREAAVLCYLQGLSRAEAAERMGISASRMRKLMDGRARRPGVAAKVGLLVETIGGGDWCEEQSSLMRALAYGLLDPEGERYRLALLHRSECPACRAYVVSLRGLAAALPPVLLPPGLTAATLGLLGEGARAGLVAPAGGGAGPGTAAAGGAGVGTLATPGGAMQVGATSLSAGGAGAGGGGWLLAGGPLGVKLAVGGLLALGVGAGCVAIGRGLDHAHPRALGSSRAAVPSLIEGEPGRGPQPVGGLGGLARPVRPGRGAGGRALAAQSSAVSGARREFGPEPALAPRAPASSAQPGAHGASMSPAPAAAEREFTPE